jgi:pentapeptide MXKDX repeat protein
MSARSRNVVGFIVIQKSDDNADERPLLARKMMMTSRIAIYTAVALTAGLFAFSPSHAEDNMSKNGMTKDTMSKDGMKKGHDGMKKDGMKHEGKSKDGMSK